MRQLLRRVWYFLRCRRFDADLREELEFHEAAIERELTDGGTDPTAARFAARRAIGSVALAQDHARDVWVPRALQGLGQDVRLAFRSLRGTPVVTAVAVLSLALGIGANTAIFSLVDSLVLRTLPVSDPERLVLLGDGGLSGSSQEWSSAVWDALRVRAQPFGGACAWSTRPLNLASSGEVDWVRGLFVSGEFFSTFGVPALMGRTLTAPDDRPDGGSDGPVAVISYTLWQQRFSGRADVVGQRLVVERTSFTIVGVTPRDFVGPEVGRAFDVAVPLGASALIDGKDSALYNPMNQWLTVMLRLASGQSIDTATALLRGVQPQIRQAAMPGDMVAGAQQDFLAAPLTLFPGATGVSRLRARYQRPLMTMLIVVALVLLIACANLANVLLARATNRRHEFSLRLALGSGRWRLVRQLLVESAMLGACGTAAGSLCAIWSSRALVAQLSTSGTPVVLDLSLDGRVLAFTAAVTVLTAVIFGAASAFHVSRHQPIEALKDDRRTLSGESRVSQGLVVAQVALSLILVVAAGLFIRTFIGLVRVPLGFDEDRVLVVNVNTTQTHVGPSVSERTALSSQLVEAAASVPGVARASGSLLTPVSNSSINNEIDVPGASAIPQRQRTAFVNYVMPGWLDVLGTPLRSGRDIGAADGTAAAPVALVNEAFVRKFLPNREPLGQTVAIVPFMSGQTAIPKTIVGVVSDAMYRSLREGYRPTLYVPLAQYDKPFPLRTVSISVRSAAQSAAPLTRSLGAALTAIDPDLSFNFEMLANHIDAARLQERVVALLSGVFAGLALLLATLGLYGVASYAVSRRRREIGVRLALGAAPRGVVLLVASRVLSLVSVGIVVGTIVSVTLSRFVATLLYGVEPRDPSTIMSAAFILMTVAGCAAALPAWRASRIDPAIVLRNE